MYLYTFEDGSIGQGDTPTREDWKCVENGTLSILQFVNGRFVEYENKYRSTYIQQTLVREFEPGHPCHVLE